MTVKDTHAMLKNQPARKTPDKKFINAIKQLLSPCEPVTIKAGDVIDINNKILVLDDGCIAIHYVVGSHQGGIKELECVYGSYILNSFILFDHGIEYVDLNYRAVTDCRIRLYDKEQFKRDVSKSNGWELIAELIAINLSHLCRLYFSANSTRVYNVIRSHLINLNTPQLKDIKSEVTIFEFISNRSSLSRSSIMQTISFLTRKSFIVVKRGKLIDIIDLPPDLVT